MKELFKVFAKDIESEQFTKREVITFAIVVPVAFILILGFLDWLMK